MGWKFQRGACQVLGRHENNPDLCEALLAKEANCTSLTTISPCLLLIQSADHKNLQNLRLHLLPLQQNLLPLQQKMTRGLGGVDPQKWSLVHAESFFKDALVGDGPRQRRKNCFDRAWIQQCSLLGVEGLLSSKGGRLMLRLTYEGWTALENLCRCFHCCFASLRRIETINFHLSHGDQDSWRGWNATHCIV